MFYFSFIFHPSTHILEYSYGRQQKKKTHTKNANTAVIMMFGMCAVECFISALTKF